MRVHTSAFYLFQKWKKYKGCLLSIFHRHHGCTNLVVSRILKINTKLAYDPILKLQMYKIRLQYYKYFFSYT